MNANDTVKSGNTNEKLAEFFKKQISHTDMALYIRRINYILSLTAIRYDENHNVLNKEWLDDGFYWLNEFAETLDPCLSIE